jgi:hypothetical protein
LLHAAHISQGSSLEEMIGIFMVTFVGGLLFAWVYAEWGFNLWVAILLHMFMNLSWDIFSAGETAPGGDYANLFRLITIALAIFGTLASKRHRGLSLEVNRKSMCMKRA